MITLGHNSSALFFNGVDKPIGYEQERLSGKKGDSSFPLMAIREIAKHVDIANSNVFISHWFDSFDLNNAPEKYYNKRAIERLEEKGCKVVSITEEFTHHDAHAYAAMAFYEDKEHADDFRSNKFYIVADGFGNRQEVLSIYKDAISGELEKVVSVKGYKASLGLMYQYATSFCGMKENQDEYKFLGYEAHISEYLSSENITTLMSTISSMSLAIFNDVMEENLRYTPSETYINQHELGECKIGWHRTFVNLLVYLDKEQLLELDDKTPLRSIIGCFIQGITENVIGLLIDEFEMYNVCLSGGCFYNVKLNNKVLKSIPGKLCVLPLAGDQGAAIGMYRKHVGKFNFHDLCYGKRQKLKTDTILPEGVTVVTNDAEMVSVITQFLREDKIVNVMKKDMEFGPRALTNTSTLALPTAHNVEYINELNGRNTVMPMAPVMTNKAKKIIFDDALDLDRVVGSNDFMIITHDVCPKVRDNDKLRGIMHKYPMLNKYSARPQIVSDRDFVMCDILESVEFNTLINTSFNTHGTPILFTFEDAVRDFKLQKRHDKLEKVVLVILNN